MAKEKHEEFLPEDIKKKLEEEKEAFKKIVEKKIEKVGAIIKHLAEHVKDTKADDFKFESDKSKFEEIKIKERLKET